MTEEIRKWCREFVTYKIGSGGFKLSPKEIEYVEECCFIIIYRAISDWEKHKEEKC